MQYMSPRLLRPSSLSLPDVRARPVLLLAGLWLAVALLAGGCGDSGSSSGGGGTEADTPIAAGDTTGNTDDAGPGATGDGDEDGGPPGGEDDATPGGGVSDDDVAGPAADDDTGAGGQPDTDTGEPGGGGGSDLEASPRAVVTLCTTLCEAIVTNCGATDVGGSAEVCTADCIAQATDDLTWIASYNCLTDSCSPAFCWMSPSLGPLPLDPVCDAFCTAFDLCDTNSLLGLPEDEPDLCRAACSGALKADETVSSSLGCWTDAMDPTCDSAAFAACQGQSGPFADFCNQTCTFLYNPQSEGYYCPAGTDQYAAWPSASDCVNACVAQEDVDALWFFYGCMLTNMCQEPSHCSDVPEEPEPDCVASCDAIFGLCGGLAQITDMPTCVGICNGVVENYPVANPDPAGCILEAGMCPEDDEGQNGLFYGCLITPPLPDIDPDLLIGAWHVDALYLADGTYVGPPDGEQNHTFHADGSYSETCYSVAIGEWEIDLETRVLAVQVGAIVQGWFVQSVEPDQLVLVNDDGSALVASHTVCGGPVTDPDEDPELGPEEPDVGTEAAEVVEEPAPPVEEPGPVDEVDATAGD